jgi:hypothetical protein
MDDALTTAPTADTPPPGSVSVPVAPSAGGDTPPPGSVSVPISASQPQPPQQPQQKPWYQRATDFFGDASGQTANVGIASGAVKGAEKTGAGLIEMLDKYTGLKYPSNSDVMEYQKEHPGSTTDQAMAAVNDPTNPYRGPTSLHTHATAMAVANWLRKNTETHGWEKVGDFGETAWELLGTMGAGEAGAAGADTVPLSKHLTETANAMKALETPGPVSNLMRIGLAAKTAAKAAVRGAAEQGAQTFIKTGGDPQQAGEAALTGGLLSGVVGGGIEAYQQGREALNEFIDQVRPQTRTISGVETPILASQNRNAPPAAAAAATIDEAPQYREQQQAAAAAITKTEAQNAVKKTLTELNAGRVTPTITDTSRQLPAPADMKPYQFTMDLAGAEPVATREGTTAFDPGKQQIGHNVIEGKGPGGFNLSEYSPELYDEATRQAAEAGTLGAPNPQPEPVGSHREPIFQYRNAVKPDQADAAERGIIEGLQGGRGTMTFSGPEQVVAGLNQLDNIISSSRFADLDQAHQTRIQNAAAGLRGQLDDFNAYRIQNPHYGQVDAEAAAQHTGDFSQGADQLEQSVQPVYDTLDKVSDGQWGSLRKIEQNMRRITRAPTTPEAYDAATRRLDEVTASQEKILNDNKTAISPEEWRAANRVWRDASTMRDIHDALEKSYNGVDADVAAATKGDPGGGIPRTMTGSDAGFKRLQALRQSRPDDVKRVLGNGYTNLYRMTDLLKDPEDAAASQGMMKYVGQVLRRHGRALGLGSVGSIGGAVLGHGVAGGGGAVSGTAAGALAGAATEAYIRNAAFRIATTPEIADRFIYAVKNRVSPRIAATLIASMITKSFGMQDKQTPPQGEQP